MDKIILAAYLTGYDPQRELTSQPDREEYVKDWYESISFDYHPVILHNSLSEGFMAKFPKVEFIKVPDPDCQLYDYRWLMFYDYLSKVTAEVVFLTDLSDVTMASEPHISTDTLYCGDELAGLDCWIVNWVSEDIAKLYKYREILSNKENRLLNCGIVGGDYRTVIRFLRVLAYFINKVKDRPVDKTVDMPVLNYVLYRFFPDCVHGFPVNSVFGLKEKRSDVWFIHK